MSMRAVVLKAPLQVEVEDRPIPQLVDPTDVIVKNHFTALCGSDLHVYNGTEPADRYDFVLGHELVGEVHQVGSAVKNFKKGDVVVSPFTVSCGDCFFCSKGQTGRCEQSRIFGSLNLDGAQAEYVLVPLADSTLYPVPPGVPKELLVLCADILPTAYGACFNANHLLWPAERENVTAVVLGCGPVGLCAVSSARRFFKTVYAVDSVPDRLEAAKKHGAHEVFNLNEDPVSSIKQLTGGRGADVVLEVVGHESAVHLAVKLIRNFGVISSCGVHNNPITLQGLDLYNKNIRMQFGRCSVRTFFKPALEEVLIPNVEIFKTFIQQTVSIEEAPKYYDLFANRKVLKTVFTFP